MVMTPKVNRGKYPLITAISDYSVLHPRGKCNLMMNHWSLVYIHDGRGMIDYGKKQFEIGCGDVQLYPPGIQQNYTTGKEPATCVHWWVAFMERAELLPLLDWPVRNEGVRVLHVVDGELRNKIEAGFSEIRDVFSRFSPPKRLDLCYNILHKILLWLDAANPHSNPAAGEPRIMKATMFMHENLDRKLTVESIARECYLSPVRFAHLFKEVTSTTPMRYLQALRLELARQKLFSTNLKLAGIAAECGFCNEFYLSSVFKKHFGLSPTAFRERQRKEKTE